MLEDTPWKKDPPEVLNCFGEVFDMSNFTGSAM